jgi:chromosome segregation ATPase
MKASKLQELIEDTPTEIREEIKLINISNNKMKNELIQKDNTIKKLKAELEKARKNALFKTARTEILVTEPTKTNVEINHELLNTKAILAKVSNMHEVEKKKAAKLDKEVKNLQKEVMNLRNSTSMDNNINNNDKKSNAILNKKIEKMNKDNKKNSNNKIEDNKELNDLSSDENEDDNSEENEDSEESSSDNDSVDNKKKKPKTKQKELDMLTEEYSKLKKQNEEYENKIQKYKKIYKEMKNKIKNLNQLNNGQKSERIHNYNNIIMPAASTDDATSHKNI